MSNYQRIMAFLAAFLAGVMLLACTLPLEAQTLSASLVVARGPNALPDTQSIALFERALAEICEETKVCAKLRRVESVKNPFQRYHNNFNNTVDVLYMWQDWFNKRGIRSDVRFAIVPPFQVSAKWYLLGYARTCKQVGAGYATAEEYNQDGAYRVPQSYIAIKHELMHTLGAKHYDGSCNIMHANAMACTAPVTLPVSVNQIQKCGGKWR